MDRQKARFVLGYSHDPFIAPYTKEKYLISYPPTHPSPHPVYLRERWVCNVHDAIWKLLKYGAITFLIGSDTEVVELGETI